MPCNSYSMMYPAVRKPIWLSVALCTMVMFPIGVRDQYRNSSTLDHRSTYDPHLTNTMAMRASSTTSERQDMFRASGLDSINRSETRLRHCVAVISLCWTGIATHIFHGLRNTYFTVADRTFVTCDKINNVGVVVISLLADVSICTNIHHAGTGCVHRYTRRYV